MSELRRYIGCKIKELRLAAGWTQTELAGRLRVTPNTISRWEGATYEPAIQVIEQLARIFEKPIWAFFPTEIQPPTHKQRALLSATGDLPSDDIDELVRYADFVRARRAKRQRRGKARSQDS